MINLLKRNILKHQKLRFSLIKDLEENFTDEDPYKRFLFDSEYTKKQLKETEYFMMPTEQKKNVLKQKLKNNHVSEIYLKYQPRETCKITGLFEDVYDLKEKVNLNKESDSFYDRFDFEFQLDPEIATLNSYKNYEIKHQADNYLKQTLKQQLDYIQVGIDFREKIQRMEAEQSLIENEVIVSGFPIHWQPFKCMSFLNDKISYIEDAKLKINKFGQVSYIQLRLKDQDSTQQALQINNFDVENATLKVCDSNSQDFNYKQRYVVVEGLQEDIDEDYLFLLASQYGKVDNVHLLKNMQLGQIGETSNFVKYLNDNSDYYQKYYTISTDQITQGQLKEIKLYEQKSKTDKYQDILSKNFKKNREYDLELNILSEQEIEDQKDKISQYFNKFKVTTIQDNIKEQEQEQENAKLYQQPLLKKGLFNNFGVYQKSLNCAIICFASKKDAQKGIYGMKFLDKISKQITLLNDTYLYEYIPHFKYKVYFDALRKHENLQQGETHNVDNVQTQLQTKNLKQQIYENWKDELPEDFQKKMFTIEANQENNLFDQNNQYLKRSLEVDKINQKIMLKQKLKKYMDDYAESQLFAKDNSFNDQLGSIQDNQQYNKQRGRDFGATQLRQATQIMKERLQQREKQNFNFFSQIITDFQDVSTNDILQELQSLSYEQGVKEALVQQFYYFKERLDMLENQNQNINQKKLRNTKKVKGFLYSPKFMFSFNQSGQKYDNQKLYDEFFQKQLSYVNGDYYKQKEFRTNVTQSQKRKQKNQVDKYADLLHIYDSEGNRFFSEEDVKEIEHEIYGEELSKIKNWEKNELNFKYQTQTPEHIVKSHFDKDLELASQYFEGFTTKLYYFDKEKGISCQKLVEKLNKNKEGKYFDFFKQSDNQYYIVEKTKLFKDEIPKIYECLQNFYQQALQKAAFDNDMTLEHLCSSIYKHAKTAQESMATKSLLEYNSLMNQVQHLKESGFDQDQIDNYFSLTESQIHRQLQYFYNLQDQEASFQKQNQDIEKLKVLDSQAKQDQEQIRQKLLDRERSEQFTLQQVKYDLVRQKNLFNRKMQAFLADKERQLLNEGVEKNKRGEIVDDDELLQEELKHRKQLFTQEIQDLFLRQDDKEVESTHSDKFFDDYDLIGDTIDETPSETMDQSMKKDLQEEEDEDEKDSTYYVKQVRQLKQQSKKLGSDEILFDLNSSVLQEKAEFEKEKEEFKDN